MLCNTDNNLIDSRQVMSKAVTLNCNDQVIIRVLSLQGRFFSEISRATKKRKYRAHNNNIETNDDDKFKMVISASVPIKA